MVLTSYPTSVKEAVNTPLKNITALRSRDLYNANSSLVACRRSPEPGVDDDRTRDWMTSEHESSVPSGRGVGLVVEDSSTVPDDNLGTEVDDEEED